jgi:hypothetical protein
MSLHADFGALLDHLAGRTDGEVARHLGSCPSCAALAETAGRLLGAGRRALAAPRPSRRAMQRAMRIFREARAPARPSLLELVLDSLLDAAPALRAAAAPAPRFLRFHGRVTVEIQATPAAKGVDLRGQLLPADFASEVLLTSGRLRRRAGVAEDGTFLFEGVPRRTVDLAIGDARIANLAL